MSGHTAGVRFDVVLCIRDGFGSASGKWERQVDVRAERGEQRARAVVRWLRGGEVG